MADNKRHIRKAHRVLESFRAIDPDMSISCALALLYSAEEEIQRDVEARLGLSNASASRNVAYWSKQHKRGVPGKDFISQYVNPDDRRYRRIDLTAKGKAFIDQLEKTMED